MFTTVVSGAQLGAVCCFAAGTLHVDSSHHLQQEGFLLQVGRDKATFYTNG
jgi:hypothetical protein